MRSTQSKIGRNDPCYCGSGEKYKKCHLARQSEARMTEGEVRGFASQIRVPKTCHHAVVDGANCAGKIISAHTVSKSGSLRRIGRNGKVYHFKPDINTLFDTGGRLLCREVGIGVASTFPGFCAHHDKILFAPIEDRPFVAGEQAATLLGYRAITKEIHAKEHQTAGVPFLRTMDRGHAEGMQRLVQGLMSGYADDVSKGLRDLRVTKQRYDAAFRASDFGSSKYLLIEFDEAPHILFSGAIYPEFDFAGNGIQDLSSQSTLDSLSINAIATPAGGAVCFQWFGESICNRRFVDSLRHLPPTKLASAVSQFAFEFLENLFIAPDWWDGLEPTLKSALEARVMHHAHASDCLIPGATQYFEWLSPRISTNLPN